MAVSLSLWISIIYAFNTLFQKGSAYCKNGYLSIGKIYTTYALELKPRKISPMQIVIKMKT